MSREQVGGSGRQDTRDKEEKRRIVPESGLGWGVGSIF